MLNINRAIFELIVAHARQNLPHEACGYLAERDGKIVAHYELTNIDEASDHFTMKPEEQFAAVQDMRSKDLSLRAVYHSHPVTSARPSAEDIRLAYDPLINYVIISLAESEPSVKAFRIRGGKVTEEKIQIIKE